MSLPVQTVAKWEGWMDTIIGELSTLLVYRHVFLQLREMALANRRVREIPSIFWPYVGDTYVHYVASAIRRQAKVDADSISLARLLRDVGQEPSFISREPYVTTYVRGRANDAWLLSKAHEAFDRFAGSAGQQVDPTVPGTDTAALQAATRTVEQFADRVVAHRDRRPPSSLPTYSDLDRAVDVVFELACKYHVLLKHAAFMFPVAQWVGDDWKELFATAWFGVQGGGGEQGDEAER